MVKSDSLNDKIFHFIVSIFLAALCVIIAYPLILIVSSSFSAPEMVMRNDVILFPRKFTIIGYEAVFRHPDIWRSYMNTIVYTVVGTAINVLMTALGAFPLSRKDFYGNSFWTRIIMFTMFFGGGMIPAYILISKLGFMDKIWVMIIPGAISTWNLIVMRSFFQNNIPMEVQEASFIDGCNDLQIFFKIVLPLSLPIMAVMVLFYGVGHWNSYMTPLIYLRTKSKFPLQLILRDILITNNTQEMLDGGAGDQEIVSATLRYSLILVANLPILMVYPFIQKYFVKGMLIGAVKG